MEKVTMYKASDGELCADIVKVQQHELELVMLSEGLDAKVAEVIANAILAHESEVLDILNCEGV